MDEEAARAAAALQQLTRLGFSLQGWSQAQKEAGQRGDSGAARGPDGAADDGRRRGGGGKCAAGGPLQRWQDHPIWGQLPLLSRLQQLAVGAELPGGGADGEEGAVPAGPGGAAVLPFDLLEGSVPDGIMDCRCGRVAGMRAPARGATSSLHRAGASCTACTKAGSFLLLLACAAPGTAGSAPTAPWHPPLPPCSSLTDLVLPVALTALPDMVPGQLPRLATLDLTHSIVEALPPSWCCNMPVGRPARKRLRAAAQADSFYGRAVHALFMHLASENRPIGGGHWPAGLAALAMLCRPAG